ncbi:uncharacterized protein LOC124417724 [Gallus gallus]|uniref:uncharacterized protein LOC124417724 n=1 Tax=Gallus gallus TaxID=9031 RepID=UPI001EFF6EAE|nr:uncharacterized protein LOC124417724 [Gallus gallus]
MRTTQPLYFIKFLTLLTESTYVYQNSARYAEAAELQLGATRHLADSTEISPGLTYLANRSAQHPQGGTLDAIDALTKAIRARTRNAGYSRLRSPSEARSSSQHKTPARFLHKPVGFAPGSEGNNFIAGMDLLLTSLKQC